MPQEADVTIIVPAYNESGAIRQVAESLRENFPGCRIIIVDDGSSDDTGAIIDSTPGITAIHHQQNRGYGAALKTGIRAAETEYVLMCDADGQHRIEDIRKVMEAADDYDMVVGIRGEGSAAPLSRRPGKFILRHFANWLAGEKLPDFNSGLRIFRRKVITQYMHLASDKFSFSTTSSFTMLKTGRRIKYVPIIVKPRIGKSSVRQLRHGTDTLMLMLRLTMLYDPLKVFLHLTGIFFVLSLLSLAWDIWFYERLKLSMTSQMLMITTVQVFLFGLVCDQVSAMRRELHERN
ncbi:glycosyltransferase family 2 protein [uncultured Victivallis sp.]|uniref:glycosyltransferase family 2 protein n=1 Tax=uncultured Victivallis sp. TaxID=354118 RepID=UPI0025DCC65D|nr:glycosyltransferase family 2 protein [uncultured Victivallis sp.]